MDRTTKKTDKYKTDRDEYTVADYIWLNEPWRTPINKLGKLEDIEEQLRTNLVKLLEIVFVTKKFYFTRCDDDYTILKIQECYFEEIDDKGSLKGWWYFDDDKDFAIGTYFKLKDYGIIWAATEEELENVTKEDVKKADEEGEAEDE